MAFTLPPLDTELDAVNLVMKAKGLDLVTSIDLDDAEIADAVYWLDGADREVQSKGWWFNKDQCLKLAIADDGTVPLPDGTLSVSNAYYYPSCIGVVERAGKLWDTSNKTFTFTVAPIVDITVRIDFPDLPEVARKAIATLAAHRAQATDQGNPTVIQITQQMVTQAMTPMEWEQDKAKPSNQVHDNITVIGAIHGFRGMPRARIA